MNMFRTIRSFSLNNCIVKYKRSPTILQAYPCSSANQNSKNEYTPVYKFPLIRTFAAIKRLNVIQGVVTLVAIPSSLILYVINVIESDFVILTSSIGTCGTLALSFLGYLVNKTIGFIYVNKKGDKVKISYLDFWGKRKDVEFEVEDLVPFSETPASITNYFYLKVKRYSTNDVLKMSIHKVEILNKEYFDTIFDIKFT